MIKKRIIIFLMILCTAFVLAEGTEIYGYFRLDYDLTESMIEEEQVGGFNNARTWLGWKQKWGEHFQSVLELDIRDMFTLNSDGYITNLKYAIRKMYVSWIIFDIFTITGGKIPYNYAPNTIQYDMSLYGVNLAVSPIDMLDISLIIGNAEKTDHNNNKNHIMIMPVFSVYPADIISIYGGAKFDINTVDDELLMGLFLGAGIKAGPAVMNAEIAFEDLIDFGNAGNLQVNFDMEVKVLDWLFVPVINCDMYYLTIEEDREITTEIGLAFQPVNSFRIHPFFAFSYTPYLPEDDEFDYTLTLRFQWKPGVKF